MKNVLCSTFGHQLISSKKITKHILEYKCKRCHSEFTINGKGQIVDLTPKYKEINNTLEKIYLKKLKKHQGEPVLS